MQSKVHMGLGLSHRTWPLATSVPTWTLQTGAPPACSDGIILDTPWRFFP